MKQLLGLLLLSVALPLQNFAYGLHTANVPSIVKTTFAQKYPEVTVRKWTSTKEGYAAKFENQRKEYTAYFTSNGNWEMTVHKIGLTHSLPAPVREGFHNSMYAAYNIDGIKEVVTNGKTTYVIRVDDGDYFDSDHHDNFTQDFVLNFSADGKLVKTKEGSW
jgi:hypothetical protein